MIGPSRRRKTDHKDGGARDVAHHPRSDPFDPATPAEAAIIGMQSTAGNSGVQELMELAGRTPGTPLEPALEASMASSFGGSFARVEVHEGPEVDVAAETMGVAAFASGEHIYLHSGVPGPETELGMAVLGEELAHVAQGVGAAGRATHLLREGGPVEEEAHSASEAVVNGTPAVVNRRPEAADALGAFNPLVAVGAGIGGLIGGLVGSTLLDDEKVDLAEKGVAEAASEATEMDRSEADKLQSQAVKPLEAAVWEVLDPAEGVDVVSVMAAYKSIPGFIRSIQVPDAMKGARGDAANLVVAGLNALATIQFSDSVKSQSAQELSHAAQTLSAHAAAVEPAATMDDTVRPELLTLEAARSLQAGPIPALEFAAGELANDAPAYGLVLARLEGLPGAIASVATASPAGLRPELTRIATVLEGVLLQIRALSVSVPEAVNMAKAHWHEASSILMALAATAADGGSDEGA